MQESYGYDNLNRLRTYTSLGGSVSPPTSTQVVYDARGNILYKSDVGRYWYDSQRPNRLANITLEGYAGAQALTGTRALSYVFDDYGSTARSNGSVPMGNGNLMYTVSHDNASGKHTVRWESYTSFNMPLEIKYGNIGAAQATTVNGSTLAATAVYSCPSGQVASGSMCTQTQTAEVRYATSCRWSFGRYRCTQTAVCLSGFGLTGSTCQRVANTQAASVSYSCPSGYSLSDRTCRAQSNSATTSDRTLSFAYGPEHQRVKQVVTLSGNAPSQMMGGTTWYLNGDNNSLLYEKELKANGVTENRHYLQAAGMTFAMVVTRSGSGINSAAADPTKRPSQVSYYQQDHLGSMAAIADENGAVIERLAYDPWGKRRYPNGLPDQADSIVGVNTDRGYTMHEHLDEVGVIHMNGRVFDPLIGRFMSADPFIQSPGNLQSYNRYAYVMNNPLAYTDPSGYWSWELKIGGITVVSINTQTIVRAAALAADVFLGGGGAYSAAVGAYYGAKNGGGLAGAVVGGVRSYFSFQFAGDFGASGYAFSAASGCATAAVAGGDCGRGATAGLINRGATQLGSETGYQFTAAALGGCASSRVSGGSCSDGAAAALGSMAAQYAAMDFAQNMRAEYDRYQYRANSTAMVGALPSAAQGAVTVWTWIVSRGAYLAATSWALNGWDRISDALNVYAKPPENAYDPNGPKTPGRPSEADGFKPPKGGDEWVRNPNGRGSGWGSRDGSVWIPTWPDSGSTGDAHGGPHLDVQYPGGKYDNIYPGGKRR